MYLHLGRGNVVRIEDIIAITDFERLTSFKKGQKYIEEFLAREDIENPKNQLFPQSCVFVLKGIEDDEEAYSTASKCDGNSEFFVEDEKEYDKFSVGGEFYLSEEELEEEACAKGKGSYERIIGKISSQEEKEVNLFTEKRFPGMKEQLNKAGSSQKTEKSFFDSEYFGGASEEEIKNILPRFNLYEKCRMAAAFRIHTANEYGERTAKEIEKREGIGYVLGFGKVYLYGKKVYYPEKTRLYIYVSEFTPHTLYKRIKEEENLLKYVGEEN